MKHMKTGMRRRKFDILASTQGAQAAMMNLRRETPATTNQVTNTGIANNGYLS